MKLNFFKGELSTYIKKLEQFFELSGVTVATNTHQKISLLTSYPSNWMDHYIHHGYDQIDPVHLKGFSSNNDRIYWGGNTQDQLLCDQQRKLFEEAKQHHIVSGVSFPLNSQNGHLLVSLAFPYGETITHNISATLIDELKSHIQILPTLMHIETLKNVAFLNKDIAAFASNHAELSQSFHTVNNEINDLLLTFNAYLSNLPTHFRYEGEQILETFRSTRATKSKTPFQPPDSPTSG